MVILFTFKQRLNYTHQHLIHIKSQNCSHIPDILQINISKIKAMTVLLNQTSVRSLEGALSESQKGSRLHEMANFDRKNICTTSPDKSNEKVMGILATFWHYTNKS